MTKVEQKILKKLFTADMGEEDRGGLPNPDPDLSKNRGGLPNLDLDPNQFLSRYYPPRDISPISGMKFQLYRQLLDTAF